MKTALLLLLISNFYWIIKYKKTSKALDFSIENILNLEKDNFYLRAKSMGLEIDVDNRIIKCKPRVLDLQFHRELQDLFDNLYTVQFPSPTIRYTDDIIKMDGGWYLESLK